MGRQLNVLAESDGFSAEEDDDWRIAVRLLTRCKLYAATLLHALLDRSAHESALHLLQAAKTMADEEARAVGAAVDSGRFHFGDPGTLPCHKHYRSSPECHSQFYWTTVQPSLYSRTCSNSQAHQGSFDHHPVVSVRA